MILRIIKRIFKASGLLAVCCFTIDAAYPSVRAGAPGEGDFIRLTHEMARESSTIYKNVDAFAGVLNRAMRSAQAMPSAVRQSLAPERIVARWFQAFLKSSPLMQPVRKLAKFEDLQDKAPDALRYFGLEQRLNQEIRSLGPVAPSRPAGGGVSRVQQREREEREPFSRNLEQEREQRELEQEGRARAEREQKERERRERERIKQARLRKEEEELRRIEREEQKQREREEQQEAERAERERREQELRRKREDELWRQQQQDELRRQQEVEQEKREQEERARREKVEQEQIRKKLEEEERKRKEREEQKQREEKELKREEERLRKEERQRLLLEKQEHEKKRLQQQQQREDRERIEREKREREAQEKEERGRREKEEAALKVKQEQLEREEEERKQKRLREEDQQRKKREQEDLARIKRENQEEKERQAKLEEEKRIAERIRRIEIEEQKESKGQGYPSKEEPSIEKEGGPIQPEPVVKPAPMPGPAGQELSKEETIHQLVQTTGEVAEAYNAIKPIVATHRDTLQKIFNQINNAIKQSKGLLGADEVAVKAATALADDISASIHLIDWEKKLQKILENKDAIELGYLQDHINTFVQALTKSGSSALNRNDLQIFRQKVIKAIIDLKNERLDRERVEREYREREEQERQERERLEREQKRLREEEQEKQKNIAEFIAKRDQIQKEFDEAIRAEPIKVDKLKKLNDALRDALRGSGLSDKDPERVKARKLRGNIHNNIVLSRKLPLWRDVLNGALNAATLKDLNDIIKNFIKKSPRSFDARKDLKKLQEDIQAKLEFFAFEEPENEEEFGEQRRTWLKEELKEIWEQPEPQQQKQTERAQEIEKLKGRELVTKGPRILQERKQKEQEGVLENARREAYAEYIIAIQQKTEFPEQKLTQLNIAKDKIGRAIKNAPDLNSDNESKKKAQALLNDINLAIKSVGEVIAQDKKDMQELAGKIQNWREAYLVNRKEAIQQANKDIAVKFANALTEASLAQKAAEGYMSKYPAEKAAIKILNDAKELASEVGASNTIFGQKQLLIENLSQSADPFKQLAELKRVKEVFEKIYKGNKDQEDFKQFIAFIDEHVKNIATQSAAKLNGLVNAARDFLKLEMENYKLLGQNIPEQWLETKKKELKEDMNNAKTLGVDPSDESMKSAKAFIGLIDDMLSDMRGPQLVSTTVANWNRQIEEAANKIGNDKQGGLLLNNYIEVLNNAKAIAEGLLQGAQKDQLYVIQFGKDIDKRMASAKNANELIDAVNRVTSRKITPEEMQELSKLVEQLSNELKQKHEAVVVNALSSARAKLAMFIAQNTGTKEEVQVPEASFEKYLEKIDNDIQSWKQAARVSVEEQERVIKEAKKQLSELYEAQQNKNYSKELQGKISNAIGKIDLFLKKENLNIANRNTEIFNEIDKEEKAKQEEYARLLAAPNDSEKLTQLRDMKEKLEVKNKELIRKAIAIKGNAELKEGARIILENYQKLISNVGAALKAVETDLASQDKGKEPEAEEEPPLSTSPVLPPSSSDASTSAVPETLVTPPAAEQDQQRLGRIKQEIEHLTWVKNDFSEGFQEDVAKLEKLKQFQQSLIAKSKLLESIFDEIKDSSVRKRAAVELVAYKQTILKSVNSEIAALEARFAPRSKPIFIGNVDDARKMKNDVITMLNQNKFDPALIARANIVAYEKEMQAKGDINDAKAILDELDAQLDQKFLKGFINAKSYHYFGSSLLDGLKNTQNAIIKALAPVVESDKNSYREITEALIKACNAQRLDAVLEKVSPFINKDVLFNNWQAIYQSIHALSTKNNNWSGELFLATYVELLLFQAWKNYVTAVSITEIEEYAAEIAVIYDILTKQTPVEAVSDQATIKYWNQAKGYASYVQDKFLPAITRTIENAQQAINKIASKASALQAMIDQEIASEKPNYNAVFLAMNELYAPKNGWILSEDAFSSLLSDDLKKMMDSVRDQVLKKLLVDISKIGGAQALVGNINNSVLLSGFLQDGSVYRVDQPEDWVSWVDPKYVRDKMARIDEKTEENARNLLAIANQWLPVKYTQADVDRISRAVLSVGEIFKAKDASVIEEWFSACLWALYLEAAINITKASVAMDATLAEKQNNALLHKNNFYKLFKTLQEFKERNATMAIWRIIDGYMLDIKNIIVDHLYKAPDFLKQTE